MADWLQAGLIGLVSGALSGAFGIGGGIVTTPAIRLIMGAPALIAVGTPLPVIVPGALTGAWSYHKAGLADMRAGLTIAIAGAPLTVFGAWLATQLGGTVVLVGTAALIVWAAGDMLLQAIQGRRQQEPDSRGESTTPSDSRDSGDEIEKAGSAHVNTSPTPLAALAGIGVLAGLYSGFLGLGGGFVIVPILTRWLRFPIKVAIGTSLITVAVLAIPGTITHSVLGNVDWRIAAGLVVGVVPGALVGSKLSMHAADTSIRIAFALLLIVVAGWLGLSELGVVGAR